MTPVRKLLAIVYLLSLIVVYCDVFVWRGFEPKAKVCRIENGCGAPAHTGGRYKK